MKKHVILCIKRITALLSAVVLISGAMPFVFAASPGEYTVASDSTVYAQPDMLSDKVGEVFKGTVVEVTDISYGFGEVFLYASGIYGWVPMNALKEHESGGDSNVTGLALTPPAKRVYIEDEEELDLDGLEVFAVLKTGTEVKVTGYSVFCDSLDSVGSKQVRVTYSPKGSSRTFSASFGIEVVRVPLKALTVETPPDKTVYREHDELDLAGLSVRAAYSDGRHDRIFTLGEILSDEDFTLTTCHGEENGSRLSHGEHSFTLSYKYPDISCSFSVSASERKLISIELVSPPTEQVTYSKTQMPSIKGLILKAHYDNGETEDVPYYACTVECDPSSFVLGTGNMIKVWFEDRYIEFNYRLAINEPRKIVAVPPQKISFVMGEPIDLSGLKVQLVYADDTMESVTDYTLSEIDPWLRGSQNVIVTYGEFSTVFTINITPFYRKGDVDGDGTVEPEDARLALRAAVGYVHLAGFAFSAADADNDGEISPADARLILRATVGLEII